MDKFLFLGELMLKSARLIHSSLSHSIAIMKVLKRAGQ